MTSVTFPVAIGGDGSTVSDDDNATTGLRNGGWRTRFIPCFTNLVNIADYIVTYTASTTAFATPPPIGSTTPNTGAFTRVTVTGSTAPANGMYLPGTNSLGFATNSSERVRIDASGNVGIGTSSPIGKLQVKAANPQIFMEDSAAGTNGKFTAIGTSNGAMTFSRYLDNGSLVGQYMTLDSSGNLGLGVTPSAWIGKALEIGYAGSAVQTSSSGYMRMMANAYQGSGGNFYYAASATKSALYEQNVGQHIFYTAGTGTAGNAISFTQAMTLDASGNLIVGDTFSAGDRLISVQSTNASAGQFKNTFGASGRCLVNWNTATSGNNIWVEFYSEASATIRGSITYNRGAGLVAYNTSSDQRLKTNIEPAGSAIESILNFPLDQFDWIDSGNHVDFGAVAQKVKPIIPEMVTVPEDPEAMWSIDWSKAVPRLIRTIQEMHTEIQELKQRIH